MQATDVISRPNLSETVQAAIRAMIVDGRLEAGARINEVHLSERLGVSRTPLREALNRLTAEGAVEAEARRGYFVRPLTLDEFEQVYGLRPILDPAALRLAGLPAAARLTRLLALNRELAAADTPEAAISLDDAWHAALLADCPNRVLLDMIETMKLRTRRYELALMRQSQQVMRATEDHAAIIAALKAGDLERACLALETNMRSGASPIVDWLKSRNSGAKR
ncbi:MAG: GntR family transcriptional regulator [Alphaproteobacteria bacterium]|nr:GntR family transcriptional regulator [Alphaproteobacteria bacterium]